MIGDAGSGPTTSPARAILVGGALPGGAVGLVFAAAGLLSGWSAAASALLGAALAAGVLALGPVIMLIARNWSPPAVMLAAMIGYLLGVVIVSVAYALVSPQSWVRGGYAGWAVLATLISWIIGQLRATARLRILVFGTGTQADGGHGKAS